MIYSQVKEYIVQPVLEKLSFPSTPEAVELLLMTIAHESKGGQYIKQVGGPALGIYQMEEATHDDIWANYLKYKPSLSFDAFNFTICSNHEKDGAKELIGNHYYATVMARMHYRRVKEAIPAREDYDGDIEWLTDLAVYAKEYYNTYKGKATPQKYLDDYLEWRGK